MQSFRDLVLFLLHAAVAFDAVEYGVGFRDVEM